MKRDLIDITDLSVEEIDELIEKARTSSPTRRPIGRSAGTKSWRPSSMSPPPAPG